MEPWFDAVAARLQWWLQGHPVAPTWTPRRRPWLLCRLGNWISDVRYRAWLATQPTNTISIPLDFAYTSDSTRAANSHPRSEQP